MRLAGAAEIHGPAPGERHDIADAARGDDPAFGREPYPVGAVKRTAMNMREHADAQLRLLESALSRLDEGRRELAQQVVDRWEDVLHQFERTSEVGRRFGDAVLWAYSGQRRFSDDQGFVGAMSVTQWVGPSFPPTLITVGNADPLAPQSEALAQSLETAGVTVERRFFTADHRPALGHEYQFDLGTQEARDFLDRMTSWLHARSARDSRPRA